MSASSQGTNTMNFARILPPAWISALLALLAAACGGAEASPPPPAPPTVEVVRPELRRITDWDEFTGRLEALESVEVRARVSGYLESIHFEDGAFVEQGQLLFVIDPRPYQAELEAVQAELARARAARDLARTNVERGRKLLDAHAIAAEDVDEREGALAQAEAALRSAQARVEAAQLDLGFTRVSAPIAGRASDHFVSVGNLVRGGAAEATLLTTIVSTDPIDCRIEADEATMLAYLRLDASGRGRDTRAEVPVEVGLADEEGYPHEGVLDFVDNRFDAQTATLRARARIPNPDGLLVPGMFARLRMSGAPEREALLVPDRAVQSEQTVRYVLVVDADDVVHRQEVRVGLLTDDGMREIEAGLEPDARVVSSGLMRARPGAQVTPRAAEGSPRSARAPRAAGPRADETASSRKPR